MEIERIVTKKLSKSACTKVPCGKCGNFFNAYRNYIWVRKSDQERICHDCAEKYYGVRKEKLTWHLPRKDLKKKSNNTFCKESCITCERKFNADRDYIWEYKKGGYVVCYECAEATVLYRQQYGFWLRGLMSEHFIPCEKCQDRLHEMMMTMAVTFYTQNCITVETFPQEEMMWQFRLKFLTRGSTSNKQVFRPCEKCQKKLRKIWETKNLHIGSEIKPPVELWRKMNQIIPELDDNIPVPAKFETNKSQILDVKEASKDDFSFSPEPE